MNRNQAIFVAVALFVFVGTVIATTWTLYAIYEAPAREAAELQQQMNAEQLEFGEVRGMQHTVDGKTLQGN